MQDKSIYSDKDGFVTIFYSEDFSHISKIVPRSTSFIKMHKSKAIAYAEKRISTGDWSEYYIPEISFSQRLLVDQRFEVVLCNDPIHEIFFEGMCYTQLKNNNKKMDLFYIFYSFEELQVFRNIMSILNNTSFKIFLI